MVEGDHLLVVGGDLRERELASRSAQMEGGRVALTGPALGPDRRADLARHARVLVQELRLRHGEGGAWVRTVVPPS